MRILATRGEKQMRRALIQKSLDELRQLVDDKVDAKVVAQVIEELRHRSTAGARKLLATLEKGEPSRSPATSARMRQAQGRGRAPGESEVFAPAPTPDVSSAVRDAEITLLILRETYTESAEILARWGATSLLPPDMCEELFSSWRRKLSETPDRLGRCVSRLDQDVRRLSELNMAREGLADGE